LARPLHDADAYFLFRGGVCCSCPHVLFHLLLRRLRSPASLEMQVNLYHLFFFFPENYDGIAFKEQYEGEN
jgi:hypothetical protein